MATTTPLAVAVLPPVRAGVCADPDWMVAFTSHAESLGYESLVLVEHAVLVGEYTSRYPYAPSGRMPLPPDCAVPDPLDTLAFLAASTDRIGLATGVLLLPVHHPVVLAKRLATLDRLARGRLRLCVGVGWLREELAVCGVDPASRGRRADEQIDVLRALWADGGDDGASFHGAFFSFDHAHSYPKPFGPDGIPIHIGGHSPASIRRAARRGDGWQPLGLAGDDLAAALATLRRETEAAGRDPDAVEVTLGGVVDGFDAEAAAAAVAAGAWRVALSVTKADLQAACDQLSATAERLGLGGA